MDSFQVFVLADLDLLKTNPKITFSESRVVVFIIPNLAVIDEKYILVSSN